MLKVFRKKLRKITFYLESIFQRQKFVRNPRPIDMVRAWKLGNKDLALQIINAVSTPLKINLTSSQDDGNRNSVTWTVINNFESEFKINFDQDEECVRLVAERIHHILPFIQKFHQSTLFKVGSIQLNLGDYAETDGLAF